MTDITTVADDCIVAHDGHHVERRQALTPDTDYDINGTTVRTLRRPAGELLCRLATVNDVHFGEVEAGHSTTTHPARSVGFLMVLNRTPR